MIEGNRPNSSQGPGMDLIQFFRILKRYHRWIGGCFLACVALSLIYTSLQQRIYESIATIIAPKEGPTGLASQLALTGLAQSISGLSIPSLAPNRELFVSILKSRTMAKDIVDQFDLRKRYKTNSDIKAINKLKDRTVIAPSKEGVISVKVEDEDPKLAADIANLYGANLNRMITRYETSNASKQRSFVAEQLAKTQADLKKAEEDLLKFQERHKAVALQEQARSTVEAAATLKGEIVAAMVKLEGMRNYATDDNPEVIMQKRSLEEMKRQLAGMEFGDGLKTGSWSQSSETASGGAGEFSVPFTNFPELNLELARLTRNLKIHETVYTLLTEQLEEAKIAEARDTPTVQLLDVAIPAEQHSRPRRGLTAAVAGFSGLCLGIFLALAIEYFKALRAQARLQTLQQP